MSLSSAQGGSEIEEAAATGYSRIMKSTFIMGGASVFTTLLGIARTKILALLLGPTGIGLAGIYLTITGLFGAVSGLGIGESGVRQIAGACGTSDDEAVSRTILCVRRMALLSGIAGLCVLFLMRGAVSSFTFGNTMHASDLALLSCTILFAAVSAGQGALIQAMRRIGDLAKLSMAGAVFGTLFSIPIIYFFGERGIAYFLLALSAMEIVTSWWYSRKIKVLPVTVRWSDSFRDAKPLLTLGLALMCGGLMTVATQYFLRVFVTRNLGLSATGVYQAASTLSFVYVGVILKAMMTDFYPRLSAAAEDNAECSSLINKQIEVGLLFAVPGILGILTFAPYVIATFYSARFLLAVDVLRWQILGGLIQVFIWPMGFIFRAKSAGKLFFWTELFANSVHLGLAWVGITCFGLPGIGMAFLAMNVSYTLLVFCIVRKKYAFKLSAENLRILVVFCCAIAVVFLTPCFLPKISNLFVNTGITVTVGLYSLKTLIDRVGVDSPFLMRVKSCFSFLA